MPDGRETIRESQAAPPLVEAGGLSHPALDWLRQAPEIADRYRDFLQRVNHGLQKGWFREPAPVAYRSLQLTGSPTRLDELARTPLFRAGRLSFEMLGCLQDRRPVAWERVGQGGRAVIFENPAPFELARRLLTTLPEPPYAVVIHGDGPGFADNVTHLATVNAEFDALHYVGDLDRPGLRTAVDAREAALGAGLPPLEPATEVHRAMLTTVARFDYPGGLPYGVRERRPDDHDLTTFVDPALRDRTLRILTEGRRVPEDVLDPDELRAVWSSRPSPARGVEMDLESLRSSKAGRWTDRHGYRDERTWTAEGRDLREALLAESDVREVDVRVRFTPHGEDVVHTAYRFPDGSAVVEVGSTWQLAGPDGRMREAVILD